MGMNFIEGNCPKCGAKTRENCNTWVYGSPVRICKSCKTEYLDRRWREVAVDGFDPRSQNSSFYLKGFIGFLIFTVLCAIWLIWLINNTGSYPSKLLGCVMVGGLGTLLCGFLYLRIKLGELRQIKTGIYLLTLLTFPYFQGFPPLKILYMYPFPLFLPL